MSAFKQFQEYYDQYEDFKRNLKGKDVPWVSQIRENAFKDFQKIGFPSKSNEAWKYTNITPLIEKKFDPCVASSHGVVAQEFVSKFSYPGFQSDALVFIDGVWAPELSHLSSLPDGCYVGSLSQAFLDKPELVKKYLNLSSHSEVNAFTALNASFMHEGVLMIVPENCRVQKPLHLLYIATEASKGKSVYFKNTIVLEKKSEASVVETYASTHGHEYLHNTVTSIKLNEMATLQHVRVQREGEGAFHFNNLDVELNLKSNYSAVFITVGGGLTRQDINVCFKGEGARAEMNGVFHPRRTQHVDYHVVVDHAIPRCTSQQLFKGIVQDEATGIFDGKIFVRKDAQSTNASQTNRNLLLSQKAKVYSKPHLEIYADDVKCTHGSSTGQLDEQALFYMRSRGIDEAKARKILTRAFAGEVIQKIKIEKLREGIEQLVFEGA